MMGEIHIVHGPGVFMAVVRSWEDCSAIMFCMPLVAGCQGCSLWSFAVVLMQLDMLPKPWH